MTKTKIQKGFTLVELIIVLTIITVLSTLAFVSLSGETALARDATRKQDLKTMDDAIAMSNARNRSITYLTPNITTGTGAGDIIKTSSGDIRVLRNATAFEVGSGFVDSTILATVSRDPKGSPYLIAFLHENVFQIASALENPVTKIQEAYLKGSFQKQAVLDNLLVAIDNTDKLLAVGKANQFVRGDVIRIDSEDIYVDDVSSAKNYIIVTRGYNSTVASVHDSRSSVKIIDFPTNASSLFCLGSLTTLAKSAADASALTVAQVPDDLSTLDLSTVILDDMYTCTTGGDISDGGSIVPYNASLQN